MSLGLTYSEKFFNELIERLPGMFFKCYFDRSYTLIRLDGSFHDLIGYSHDDIFHGKRIDFIDLIHLEDKKWLRIKRQEQIDNGVPLINEYRLICRQGKIKWVRELLKASKDEASGQIVLEGFVQDITAQKNQCVYV